MRDTTNFVTNTWDGHIIPFRQCLIRGERFVQSISLSVYNFVNLYNPQILG